MAAVRTRGCKGVIHVKPKGASGSATRMFGVNAWDFAEDADRDEASEIGECEKTFIAGAVESSGSLSVWWDPTATANQGDMEAGEEVDLEIYPGGATSGSTFYKTPAAGAVVLGVNRSGAVEGAVASAFNFTVNGKMTATSVP